MDKQQATYIFVEVKAGHEQRADEAKIEAQKLGNFARDTVLRLNFRFGQAAYLANEAKKI